MRSYTLEGTFKVQGRKGYKWFLGLFGYKGQVGSGTSEGEMDVPLQHLCGDQPQNWNKTKN